MRKSQFRRQRRRTILMIKRRQIQQNARRGIYCSMEFLSRDVIAILSGDDRKTKEHIRVTSQTLSLFCNKLKRKSQGWSVEFEVGLVMDTIWYFSKNNCSRPLVHKLVWFIGSRVPLLDGLRCLFSCRRLLLQSPEIYHTTSHNECTEANSWAPVHNCTTSNWAWVGCYRGWISGTL